MSLSKVFKHSTSFVPKQLLPNQGDSSLSMWQDMTIEESSRKNTPESFATAPPQEDKKRPEQQTGQSGEEEKTSVSETVAPPENAPAPAIDLKMIREQAFSEGVLEGRRQADEDFGSCAFTLRSACNQLTNLHETILRNNLQEMHNLVMIIAEKIIRHSLAEQSKTILATIEDAIRLAVKSEEFQIRISPEDLEILKQKKKEIIDEISGLDNIVLKTDSSIERGGCILESTNCTVDATIGSQLQVIREALDSSQESGSPPPSLSEGP